MAKTKRANPLSVPAFSVLSATPSPTASQAGAALARRALRRSDRAAPVAGSREIKMLGQRCPICREGNPTVEMRMGPLYAKICEACFGSGMHVLRLLGKMTE